MAAVSGKVKADLTGRRETKRERKMKKVLSFSDLVDGFGDGLKVM